MNFSRRVAASAKRKRAVWHWIHNSSGEAAKAANEIMKSGATRDRSY
jgi:hypothetical protein